MIIGAHGGRSGRGGERSEVAGTCGRHDLLHPLRYSPISADFGILGPNDIATYEETLISTDDFYLRSQVGSNLGRLPFIVRTITDVRIVHNRLVFVVAETD